MYLLPNVPSLSLMVTLPISGTRVMSVSKVDSETEKISSSSTILSSIMETSAHSVSFPLNVSVTEISL